MVELPKVIILGTQKGASTFLLRGVEDHPEIRTESGEWKYFEDPFYANSDFMSSRDEKKLFLVKRAEYLAKPEVPSRIYKHIPDVRLICVLRNPVERLLSAYFHNIKYGKIPAVNPEIGISKILDGSWNIKYPESSTILSYGKYGEQLERYLNLFSINQILLLDFSEVVSSREATLKKVYRFCGVNDNFVSSNVNKKSQAVIYSLKRLSILSKYRVQNKSKFGLDGIRWNICEIIDRTVLASFLKNNKPELSKILREKLENYYAEDQMLLKKMIGGRQNHEI